MTEAVRMYSRIHIEYDYDADIFCPDTPKGRETKRIIAGLDKADRVLIQLYADIASYRKLAKLLGVSRGAIGNEVVRIKNQIKREYERIGIGKNRS